MGKNERRRVPCAAWPFIPGLGNVPRVLRQKLPPRRSLLQKAEDVVGDDAAVADFHQEPALLPGRVAGQELRVQEIHVLEGGADIAVQGYPEIQPVRPLWKSWRIGLRRSNSQSVSPESKARHSASVIMTVSLSCSNRRSSSR